MAEKLANITNIQALLLRITSESVFGTENSSYTLPVLSEEDSKELFKEAYVQSVSAAALDGIANPKEALGPVIYAKWLNIASKTMLGMQRVFANHAYVAEELEKAQIPYVILKGCASAYYYNKPYVRAMGDVDFLIKESDLEKGIKLFEQQGWVQWENDHICHVVLEKEGVGSLEMHFNPPGIPYGTKAESFVREITDGIIASAQRVTVEDVSFCMPDTFHQFFVLLLHTHHHMVCEGIGLRHLCDFAALFANSVDKEMWETRLVPAMKKCGLYRFACVLLECARKYLNMPCHGIVFEADKELVCGFMTDILTGGNFGRNEKERAGTGGLVYDFKSAKTDRNIISQAFFTAKGVTEMKCPAVKKYPVLLPFAMSYFAVRSTYRTLFVRKNMRNPAKLMSVANRRKKLFNDLKIFERED